MTAAQLRAMAKRLRAEATRLEVAAVVKGPFMPGPDRLPKKRRRLKAAGCFLLLALLWAAPAWAQTIETTHTLRFKTMPNVDAYSVIGQLDGQQGWSVLASVAADACPTPPGECSLTFPTMGPVRQCWRILVVNFVGSAASKLALCFDPVWEPPVPPEAFELVEPQEPAP